MRIDRLGELASDLRFRLRALVARGAMERDLDEELRFHLEREAEKLVALGVEPDEAARRARLAFGGVERFKDEARDVRGISALEVVAHDVRYALRGLRARPGFTAAVVLTLGLGLGANAAMFDVVDRLLFRAPPFLTEPARTHRVYLEERQGGEATREQYTYYTRFLDLERWTTRFERMAAYSTRRMAVGEREDAREMSVAAVSGTFWDFFDAPPALGRYFTPAEDRPPRGTAVVVLGHTFWMSRFGGRPDVLGSTIRIGSTPCVVIGVAPPRFVGVGDNEPPVAYVPVTTFGAAMTAASYLNDEASYYTKYRMSWVRMLVRRRADASEAAATADLTSAFRRSYLAQLALDPKATPIERATPTALITPVPPERGPDRSPLAQVATWTGGVALVVLLIACANVANLMLARAMGRRREIALRLALGVSRGRLLAQLLTESLLLAALGGVAGLATAWLRGRALETLFLPEGTPDGIANGRTLAVALLATLAAGLLTGLAPAAQALRGDPAATLKSGAREGTYQRSRTRTLLLVLQGALSVVLLVGAGLFVRSLRNVQALRLGYDVEPVLFVSTNMRGVRLDDSAKVRLARQLQEAAEAMPGVASAARAVTVPFWNTWWEDISVPGVDSTARLGIFTLQTASSEYFRTLGTRVVRGRGILEGDRAGAVKVVVVSEGMARVLWPGREALGRCVRIGSDTMPCRTVVGVAEDIKQTSLRPDRSYQYYLPIDQFHPEQADVFVRARGDAPALGEALRRRLQTLMPGASYVTVTPMRDIVSPNLRSWKIGASMFLGFGALALALAAVGLYAVIAYTVAQRRQELGVRVALGAGVGDVVRLVVGQGVRFAVAGVSLGVLVALAAGRWVEPLLFAVSPRDPLVLGAVSVTLLAVAAAASLIPALRAARVDPNAALRAE